MPLVPKPRVIPKKPNILKILLAILAGSFVAAVAAQLAILLK
jgi:hypothetical protein